MPSIEQHYDKVTLSHEELQTVLRDHIEKTTGRKVRGDIYVSGQAATTRGQVDRMFVSGTHAHTFLEPAIAPPPVDDADQINKFCIAA